MEPAVDKPTSPPDLSFSGALALIRDVTGRLNLPRRDGQAEGITEI